MPITFTVDFTSKTIYTTAVGTIDFADLVVHLRAKDKANLLSYAELFDARDVLLDVSASELREIADEVRSVMGSQTPARIAVVTNSAFIYGLAETYAALTVQDNPQLRIFRSLEEANAWILAKPVG